MKLASLKGPGRDWRLVVVSSDLARAVEVPRIAPTLQAALDDWAALAPALEHAAEQLERDELGQEDVFAFEPAARAAPLPRVYQFADASAYLNHVALVRRARGAELPPELLDDPLMYQGAPDGFLGPADPIEVADEAFGIDLEAEVAVITDDVPMGITPEAALGHVRARDAAERRLASPADPGRARQGLRLLPWQAAQRLLAGRGHAGPARRCLAGRPPARRAPLMGQWQGARSSGRRGRDAVRLRLPDRARRQDPAARRRHDHRLRHGLEPGPQRRFVLSR
jgi:hypothetical protein